MTTEPSQSLGVHAKQAEGVPQGITLARLGRYGKALQHRQIAQPRAWSTEQRR